MKKVFKNKPLFVVRVIGESGWPHLVSGSSYLATSLRKPRVGDFVVFPNPQNQEAIFVKRVRAVTEKGYEVESSVSWGSSSRDFGPIAHKSLLGKVLWRIK